MSGNNLQEIWNISFDLIKKEYISMNQENEFNLWFNMKYIEDDINTIKVAVPSEFMWNSMKSKGNVNKIISKIKEVSGLNNNIEIIPVINNELISKEETEEKPVIVKPENTKKEEPVIIKKETKNQSYEKYTFDNFIAGDGSSSKFAYNVALAVANNPGENKKNPLLLYGGVGLGKTHLMRAIGNRIKEITPDKKICYIQAESFLNEFTKSMANKNQDAFKSKYRKLDILLLDDIQFLQNKPGIQDELFYTFESLKEKKAQMVFTCDRPLKEIENMKERLISRIGSGMCVDLQPPNFETRKAIIYKNLENEHLELSEEVIDVIASMVETNIRDLESALTKILNYAEFLDKPINAEIAQQQLQDLYTAPKIGNVSIENIFKVVANEYNINVSDIKGKKRDKKISEPRHIALYIAKELTEYTFTELGNECGGRDHSSIMHAVDKISERFKTDPNFNQMINLIIKEIKQFKN